MIFTENNLIGNESYNKELIYYGGGDSEECFIENCKTQPNDWYYRNISFTYKYNNEGHRCKDIKDIDLDNYILFTGCSHAEGVGLELEKSYPYIISKVLNMDYYNLGLGGTGIDVVEYNLLTWLSLVKKKPKILIIQWPDYSRFIGINYGYKNLIPKGTWTKEPETDKFMVSAEMSGFYKARSLFALNLIKQVYNINTYCINIADLSRYDITSKTWKKIDVARDLCHFGMKSHQLLADTFLNEYADKYINARDNHDIRG